MRYPLIKKAGALALATALIAPTGAVAQSTNSVSDPLPITFDPNNIGEIILFMFNTCNALGNSQMANGPFRRLDVTDSDSTGPVPGGGGSGLGGGGQSGSGLIADSRLDYVTLDITSDLTAMEGHSLTPAEIQSQIGINPGITLSVDITYDPGTDIVTIDDSTDVYSQILDLGGFDAVMLFGGQERNRVNVVCDMNAFRINDSDEPAFGLEVANQTSLPSRAIIFWAGGPSPFAHQALADLACDGANYSTANSTYDKTNAPDDPHESREVLTVGLGGDAAVTYGNGALEQPANYTGCGSLANYCDPGEPTPPVGTYLADDETNLCNPLAGTSSPAQVSLIQVNAGNDSCTVSKYGFTMRLEPCPPE